MEIGDVVATKPISSVEIEIAPEYVSVCRTWLVEHNCAISETDRKGWYLVGFPEGTVVQDRLGLSGHYSRKQYIVLPQESVEMTLLIASPVNSEQKEHVSISFPRSIFPKV